MLIQNNSATRPYTIGQVFIAPGTQATVPDDFYDEILGVPDLVLIGAIPSNTTTTVTTPIQALVNVNTGGIAALVKPDNTAIQIPNLVTDASQNQAMVGPYANMTLQKIRPDRYFSEVSPGVYLASYNFAKQLATFNGNIVTSNNVIGGGSANTFPIATFNWNDTTSAQGLYTNGGATIISGGNCAIQQVWRLSTGAHLMISVTPDDRRYIHRIAPTTYNVGTSANNRRASLHVGSLTGGGESLGTPKILALHQRSLCEAKIGTARKVIFAEYNVAAARTDGGANDQVVAWVSTDDGVSFTKLLEFNTDGTKRFDHIHSVIQNPYTGIIYFLTGDVGNRSAIISWDGISTAPAANASLATIASTPGWAITYGDEMRRYGDFIFSPDGRIYGLPDSDTNKDLIDNPLATNLDAFSACVIDNSLKYVSNGTKFVRQNDICPLIALRCKNGAMVYGSLRTTGASTAGEPYHHFWTSVNGIDWVFAGKIKNQVPGVPTANVLDLWQDSVGNVIASVTYGRGGSYGETAATVSCAIFKVNIQYSPITFFKDV